MKYEVIICTMNRPVDFERAVQSVFSTASDVGRLVVVDASRPEIQALNLRALGRIGGLDRTLHVPFEGRPSLARQRNAGLDRLRSDTAIVHFLDDDVTLNPGYIQALNTLLTGDPAAAGAGGRLIEPVVERKDLTGLRGLASNVFLLNSAGPGRVLRSGWTTPSQTHSESRRFRVEWLGGCCAYSRALLGESRFDPHLEGYSLDEDLDFSFRMSKRGELWFTPDATLVHHRSTSNRMNSRELTRDAVIHRYWFVRKNLPALSRLAFWWSLLGRHLAMKTSQSPESVESVAGLKEGIAAIRKRDHYLLSDAREKADVIPKPEARDLW